MLSANGSHVRLDLKELQEEQGDFLGHNHHPHK